MSKQTAITIALAGVLVAGVWGWIAYSGKMHRLVITGSVLKVRSQQLEPGSIFVVTDFRIQNPSPQQLEVKDVQVLIETADGKTLTGESVSDVDAVRVMEFYKAIGPKYNATLVRKNKLPPGQTADRMIAAQFGASEQEVQRRRSLRLVVRDLDGATFDLVEKR